MEYNYLHFRADVSPRRFPHFPAQFGGVDVDIQNVVVRLNYRFSGCCLGLSAAVASNGP